MTQTQELAQRFPAGLLNAAQNLNTDNQFAVLALLIREGSLSFNQIKNMIEDIHQQSLSNALSQLQAGGYVMRKEIVDSRSDYSTRYELTTLGERILEGLLDAFEPRAAPKEVALEASGHQYHNATNPYTTRTKQPHRTEPGPLPAARQEGGPSGEKVKVVGAD